MDRNPSRLIAIGRDPSIDRSRGRPIARSIDQWVSERAKLEPERTFDGSRWISMDLDGSRWISMDPDGSRW
eukprot:6394965-Lingulodinium_polyedra.AAC.1